MDLSKYTVDDFLNEPGFIEWARHLPGENAAYWERLLQKYPDKANEVLQAKEIALALNFETKQMSGADFEEVRYRIMESIHNAASQKQAGQPVMRTFMSGWMKTAAAVSTVLIAGLALLYFISTSNLTTTETTAYGEKKELTLPDGSIVTRLSDFRSIPMPDSVTLNSNSTISFNNDWEDAGIRQVTLIGEGYFKVARKVQNEEKVKFQVQAGNVTIEVVGTSFNVKQRDEKVEVALEEGKVNLKSDAKDEMELNPGELAQYSETKNQFEKQKINTSIYTAWRDNQMIFESTPISQIVKDIRHLYGVEVVLEDQKLVNKEFTGVFPADDLDVLITSLCKAYQLMPVQSGDKILLTEKK